MNEHREREVYEPLSFNPGLMAEQIPDVVR